MKYFESLSISLEEIDMLVASEFMQCATVGEIPREGFVDAWSAVGCTTVPQQKAHIQTLLSNIRNNKDAYKKVYKHTFALGLTPPAKSMALDSAITYWQVLFTSPYSPVRWTEQGSASGTPWLSWWTEFLTSKFNKAVTRDLWSMTLSFAEQCLGDETLGFHSEEQSWPGVIDEFVDWVKEKRGDSQPGEEMEY